MKTAALLCIRSALVKSACLWRPRLKSNLPLYITGMVCCCVTAHAAAQQQWPVIAFPKSVKPFPIGEAMTVNGLPMKLKGFLSDISPAELKERFRSSLGKPLVENSIGAKLLLGRAIGTYYLTVQIEPAGHGSKGVVAIADFKAMRQQRAELREARAHWLDRLPAGSTIASQVLSKDAGKTANHMVIVNGHSESVNRDAIEAVMNDDGLYLEREAAPDEKTLGKLPAQLSSGRALFFKGLGKEAMAVVTRDGHGRTSVVLNIATAMERSK